MWRNTIDGVVVLGPYDTEPFLLSGTAAVVWDMLGDPVTLDDVTTQLADAYDVDVDRVRSDVEPLMIKLERRRVLRSLS